jgi:hypothetical protein
MTSRRSTAGDRRGEPPVLRDDRVIPAALAAGLLAADDIVLRTVEVHAMGRSHPVHRVSVDGRSIAVLKTFGPRRGDTDGELAREAAVMDLAARVPAVARVVPPPLRWRGPEAVMAAGFVEGVSAASMDGMGGAAVGPPIEWEALVAALASPLARMHADTQRLDPVPPVLHTSIP